MQETSCSQAKTKKCFDPPPNQVSSRFTAAFTDSQLVILLFFHIFQSNNVVPVEITYAYFGCAPMVEEMERELRNKGQLYDRTDAKS